MKTADQIKPNNGPVYAAAMYKDLAAIFVKHGYALAVHGSLARDLDVIGIPWVEKVSPPDDVVKNILEEFAVKQIDEPHKHPHGRIVYTFSIGWGDCFIDLGFMPVAKE